MCAGPALEVQERGVEAGEAIGAHARIFSDREVCDRRHTQNVCSLLAVGRGNRIRSRRARTIAQSSARRDCIRAGRRRTAATRPHSRRRERKRRTNATFPPRRRRIAAAALLPIAAIARRLTAASAAAPTREAPRSTPPTRSVPIGEPVTLAGAFPAPRKAPIEIRYRAKGAEQRWRTVAARPHRRRRPLPRCACKPRRSGYWRAELGDATRPGGRASRPADGRHRHRQRADQRPLARPTARVAGRHARRATGRRSAARSAPRAPSGGSSSGSAATKLAAHAGRDGRFEVALEGAATGTYPVEVSARSNETRDRQPRLGRRGHASTARRPRRGTGPGLYGNHARLRRHADAVDDRRRPQDAALRDQAPPALRRPHGRPCAVIDRGPFAGSREFDLTEATKQALGFPDVGTVLTTR